MSLKTQSKVLRTLDEQRFTPVGSEETTTVDVRVIASTNKDLEEEISKGNFREDLFYRLNVIPFFVPPLRERQEDIPMLARHFLKEFSAAYGRRPGEITDGAIETLMRYSWPGNVRELRNVIERIVIMNPTTISLRPQTLPPLVHRDGVVRKRRRIYHPASGASRLRAGLHPQKAGREPRKHQPGGRSPRARAQSPLSKDEDFGNCREGITPASRFLIIVVLSASSGFLRNFTSSMS